jgi:TonB-linked SusC/RagA family outer membrane protein
MKKLFLLLFATCFMALSAYADRTVSGQVLDAVSGEPLLGATVQGEGVNRGTATDLDGHFTLVLPDHVKYVNVSYIGYATRQVEVSNNMIIKLSDSGQNLDEVVVVAYGSAKRQSITGSISVVDEKKIKDRIGSSVTAALEGSTPGIQVNNTYGEPGAAPNIRIRGIGSITGSSTPLYVVDGVAFDGNIAEINPVDIESMSVLKDAASAALYGNRAANGVVLITTKKGSYTNKPTVTLRINQGMYKRGIAEYDRMKADQWMETSWIAMKNFAMNGSMHLSEADAMKYASDHLISDYVKRNIYDAASTSLFDANGKLVANVRPGYTDLDWEEAVERTGYRQDYSLSGNAGGEKYNVYASAGYTNEQGYIQSSAYERFTGRINSNFTPNDWFKAGVNLSGTYATRNFNDNATSSYYANPFYTARYMAPVYPYYMHDVDGALLLDDNGDPIYDTESSYLTNRNIAYELRNDFDRRRRAVIEGMAYGTFTLPYGFSLTLKADFMHSNTNRRHYNNPFIGDGATNGGRLTSYAYEYNTRTAQEILNWSRDFDVHHIDVMLAHENYDYNSRSAYGMNTGSAADGIYTPGNFQTNSYFQGSDDEDKTESYLGRARYNYHEKYFADFSFRRDGSSRFSKDNRWGNFFSFGVNWNIKKENFLQDVKWLDELRVRASYGETGNNMGVSLYAYQALYYIEKNAGSAAFMKQSLSANDIKWETCQNIDFGIEGRVFDRLNFNVVLFDKRNKDLLFAVPLPLSAGSFVWADALNMSIYKNIGTISNRGIEISLNADVVRTKDFTWNLGTEGTFMKSKIKKLPDGKDILHGQQNYSEGHDPYEFYTYHFEGVDQMTGRSLYTLDPDMKDRAIAAGAAVEINGETYTTMPGSYGKRDWAGSAHPWFYGSLNSIMQYKGFALNALFTYSLGGKVYDGSYQTLMSTNTASSASANHCDLSKSWNGVPAGMTETSPNRIDPNGIPQVDFQYSTYNNATSDRWLTSASYFVVKNITLSYSLPKLLMNKIGLQGLTLTTGVENLATFTSRKGLNPQFNFSGGYDDTYVTARVFNFGLQLQF